MDNVRRNCENGKVNELFVEKTNDTHIYCNANGNRIDEVTNCEPYELWIIDTFEMGIICGQMCVHHIWHSFVGEQMWLQTLVSMFPMMRLSFFGAMPRSGRYANDIIFAMCFILCFRMNRTQRTNAPEKKMRENATHPNGHANSEPHKSQITLMRPFTTEMIMHRMSCRRAVVTLCRLSVWFSTLHATHSRAYVCRIIRQWQCDRQTVHFFSFPPILLCIVTQHTHTHSQISKCEASRIRNMNH